MKKNSRHTGVKDFRKQQRFSVNSIGTWGTLASSIFRLLYSDVTTPASSTSGQQEAVLAIAKDPVEMALGAPLCNALLSPELPDALLEKALINVVSGRSEWLFIAGAHSPWSSCALPSNAHGRSCACRQAGEIQTARPQPKACVLGKVGGEW